MRISVSQQLRRGIELERRRLPELGAVKVQRPRGIALRRGDPVKFKFCKGYAHPSLIDTKP